MSFSSYRISKTLGQLVSTILTFGTELGVAE